MIQDILPHIFNNQYAPHTASSKDVLVSFDGGKVGMLNSTDSSAQYLFAVDDIRYFLTTKHLDTQYESLKLEGRSKEQNFIIATANQLHRWYSSNRFCGACGHSMRHSKTERMLYCPICNNQVYPQISPAIIVGVTHGNKLLVTKYADRPYKDYALVAGFNEIGESIEDTVRREVMEEVGIKIKNLRFYKSQPWAFSGSILMGFWAELDNNNEEITLDRTELSEAKWLTAEEIFMPDDDISLTNEMINMFKQQFTVSVV